VERKAGAAQPPLLFNLLSLASRVILSAAQRNEGYRGAGTAVMVVWLPELPKHQEVQELQEFFTTGFVNNRTTMPTGSFTAFRMTAA
jgi:hypothetical protein